MRCMVGYKPCYPENKLCELFCEKTHTLSDDTGPNRNRHSSAEQRLQAVALLSEKRSLFLSIYDRFYFYTSFLTGVF